MNADVRTRLRDLAGILAATALLATGCGDDGGDGDGGADGPGATLTVDQVVDFMSEFHAGEPLRDRYEEPLTDCNWKTDGASIDAWTDDPLLRSAALFHCTGDTDDEDGDYPVFVHDYRDLATARKALDDELLASDTTRFLAESKDGAIVVGGFGDDVQRERWYQALMDDCDCGEVWVAP